MLNTHLSECGVTRRRHKQLLGPRTREQTVYCAVLGRRVDEEGNDGSKRERSRKQRMDCESGAWSLTP